MKKLIFITILIVFNIVSFGIYPQPDGELSYNILLLGDSWQEVLISYHENSLKERKGINVNSKNESESPLILSSIYLGEDKNNLNPVDIDSPQHYYIIEENLEVGKKYFWKYVYKDPQTEEIIFESEIHTFTVSENYIFLKKVFNKIVNAGFFDLNFDPNNDLILERKKELILLFEEVLNEIGNYYLQKYNDINLVFNKINEFINLIKMSYYSSKYFLNYVPYYREIFEDPASFYEKDITDDLIGLAKFSGKLIQLNDMILTKNDNMINFITFFGFWLEESLWSDVVYEGIDLRYFVSINRNKFIAKKVYDKNFNDIDNIINNSKHNYYPSEIDFIQINITNDGFDDYIFYLTNDYRVRHPKVYAIFSYNNDYKVYFLGYSRTKIIKQEKGYIYANAEIKIKNIDSKHFELYIPYGMGYFRTCMADTGPIYYKIYTYNEKENEMKYLGYDFPDSKENMTRFFASLLMEPETVEEYLHDEFTNILNTIISKDFKIVIDKNLLEKLTDYFPSEQYELKWEENGFNEFDLFVAFDNSSFFKVNSGKIKDNKYILYVPLFVKNVKWKIRAYKDDNKFIESEIKDITISEK